MVRSAVLALALLAAPALAQNTAPAFEPEVGQAGKDVVWVPTPQVLVDKMLDMAKLTPKDFLMDLGSGDGRTVITAAKRGARAVGIEYNPNMVELSKRNAVQAGVGDKAAFMKADLFETDLSRATVITMFLLPDINLKLRPKLLALKPGTRVVSNSFTMGEWKADEIARLSSTDGCSDSWCTALLWIIPQQVAGTYTLPQGELTLKQEFQVLSGTLKTAGRIVPLEGLVRGDALQFTAGGREYRGVVKGKNLVLQDK
jgi:precorrin-6B methylase 2